MSTASTTDSAALESVLGYVDGFATAKYLALSSFVLLVYDHLTSLDQEFEFFWEGGWSTTRVLYFLVRSTYPLQASATLYSHSCAHFTLGYSLSSCKSVHNSHYDIRINSQNTSCTAAIRTATSFMLFGMFIVEAILITRVYYLWSHSRPVQYALCVTFVVCTSVAIGFAGRAIHVSETLGNSVFQNESGCISAGNGLYWPIFLPTFVSLAILFGATIIRILRPMRVGKNRTVVNRLLRDGGFFYLVVFSEYCTSLIMRNIHVICLIVSVGFTGIGSLMLQHPKASTASLSIPALLSNSLLAIHSICASHLILSIHSLAADMGSDPTFLLSNIEISRIAWRRGNNPNELIVDVNANADSSLELTNLDPFSKGSGRAQYIS
ncbi:hypothetical protein DFH11DRAFT_1526938 [Phellopilus nigrolimitatus]|nr:hypothetical protein DFH11DRAFT_1526938 [Phellopilus nigrolimitatus]